MSGAKEGESKDTKISINDENIITNDSKKNFLKLYKDDISKLNGKVSNIISSMNIDLTGKKISIGECIKVVGLIKQSISGSIGLMKGLSKLPPDDKVSIVFLLILEILSSDQVQSKLSPEISKQIQVFAGDTETVIEIANLVDWINDKTLDKLDINKDGLVTQDELIESCVKCCLCKNKKNPLGCSCYRLNGCCKCCIPFSEKCGKLWSWCFLRILCCNWSTKEIKYNRKS